MTYLYVAKLLELYAQVDKYIRKPKAT
jgi:hypothetical protein